MEGVIGRHAEPAARKSAAGVPSAVFPTRRLQIAFLSDSTHCLRSIFFNFVDRYRFFFDESNGGNTLVRYSIFNDDRRVENEIEREGTYFNVIKKITVLPLVNYVVGREMEN